MRNLYLACLVLAVSFGCKQTEETRPVSSQKAFSVASELEIFHDLTTLPQYIKNSFSAQISSYDTTWQNDDGFSGKYSFLKRNADSTLVLFDVEGAGVINRIWTPTPTEDTLDFFIDQDDRATFSIKFSDLFSGVQFPFVAPLCGNELGGFYCYLPVPFSKSCKIISRGKKVQFHQIQYRLYPPEADVESFVLPLNVKAQEALKKIQALWGKQRKNIQDFYPEKLSVESDQFDLKRHQSVIIFEANQGGRIVGIELEPSVVFEGLQKNVDIRVTWNNERNPAVFCPVADFFGYAFGVSSMQSLLLGTQDKKSYCYFPMPFDDAAKIELINRSDSSMSVTAKIYHNNEKRSSNEGKFYAYWHKNIDPQKGVSHTLLNVQSKGHYVGTILQSQGLRAGMTLFFEGDDSTAIDGKFRMHGTGSEDYFNGGWYALLDRWDDKMSLPLHGSLDYSLPFARTGGYRLFLSDKLSFEKSLYHSIEHGPVGNAFPVDYTSLAFYYADEGAKQQASPDETLTKVFLPDTLILYPQLLDFNIAGNLGVKTSWKYRTGGESYFFTGTNDSWIRISLDDIPHGTYKLFADVQKKPDGCEFSLWQRQSRISEWISTYESGEIHAKGLYVCDIDVQDFKETMTIRFKIDGQRNNLLLHRFTLVRTHP